MPVQSLSRAALLLTLSAGTALAAPPPGVGTAAGGRPPTAGQNAAGGLDRRPITPPAAAGTAPHPATPPTPHQAVSGLSRRPVAPGREAGLTLRPDGAGLGTGLSRRPTDLPTPASPAGDPAALGRQNRPDFSYGRPGLEGESRPHLFGRVFGLQQRDHRVPAAARSVEAPGLSHPPGLVRGAEETETGAGQPQERGRPGTLPPVAQAAQRRDLSQAERLLALRLAQIDHLRDVALQNGNAELMQQADKLEELARAQFDRRRNDDPTEPVSPPSDAPETPEP